METMSEQAQGAMALVVYNWSHIFYHMMMVSIAYKARKYLVEPPV